MATIMITAKSRPWRRHPGAFKSAMVACHPTIAIAYGLLFHMAVHRPIAATIAGTILGKCHAIHTDENSNSKQTQKRSRYARLYIHQMSISPIMKTYTLAL